MATAYQAQSDPTKVMGRRYGAYIVDGAIGAVIALIGFAFLINYETISGEAAERTFGNANLCADATAGSSSEPDACSLNITLPGGERLDDRFVFYDGSTNYIFTLGSGALIFVLGFAYWLLNQVIWQGLAGRTIGKSVFGIRTVNEAGQAPGMVKAFVRTLLFIVDGLGCGVPLVGPITAGTSKGHRRVGDMAAKTFVVGADDMGSPVVIPGLTTGAAGAAMPGAGMPGATGPADTASPPWSEPPAGQAPSTDQAGWAAPTQDPATAWTPPPEDAASTTADPTTAAAAGSEPQWDEARQAYIQWDGAQQCWLQFDDATQQWRRIE